MTFTPSDLDAIAARLATTGEIDASYSYVGMGATAWDRYVRWQEDGGSPNILTSTLSMLRDAHEDLIAPLRGPVRVVDLGPGNGAPVRGVLERLQAAGRLERYVAVDTSPEMLTIAQTNLRSWLGPAAELEFHRRDFASDALADLRGPATLVLLTGGTLLNFADPVAVLRHVRQIARVVAFTVRADTVANRIVRFGEDKADARGEAEADLPMRLSAMLDQLGVPREYYEPEFGFDETTRQRYLRVRLTRPATVAGRVTLPVGYRVQLLRYLHRSPEELTSMLDAAGYQPLTVHRRADGEFLLIAGRSA
ncbi:L-histidine N(alpha)-methyltransferase [Catellatospora bangladeshensis]|uniref:Histidine-specific methyltransferase SAM-dependent domain-containing protein n=1 Tax=Catellatospora bangladeshensis TaxID=310355 RepID=A0A8J3JMW0_9ACTN|nr:class I SAM-dependent methyltransferase [Catellatospora bangladeshensis]GIF81633.1 hypothetical protein Cba03nite_29820 [Catellatospora bangladeshensis]